MAENGINQYLQETDSDFLDLDYNFFDDYEIPEHTDSIYDAFIRCRRNIRETGIVDIARIAESSGATAAEVINALRGAIYRNPRKWDGTEDQGWETAAEYLSGNLREKLEEARQAERKYEGVFTDNIEALEALLPPEVKAEDIYVAPGSPWLPAEIIDDFINHLIQLNEYQRYSYTIHDAEMGSWALPGKSDYSWYVRNKSTFGTERMNALDILEDTLNMKTVRVTDRVRSKTTKSGFQTVINKEETAAAQEKQRLIIDEFRQWIWQDEARKKKLKKIFEEKYASSAVLRFNGGFLEFPGMSDDFNMYPYQKDAVARILLSPNTLLAHDVGAGKTYIMIAAAMEMRRLGLAEKCMFVVPNSLVGQWRNTFLMLYPDADLLIIEPDDMAGGMYNRAMQSIIDASCDGIIIASSCFDRIPISRQAHIESLKEKRDEMMKIMERRKKVTPAFKRKLGNLIKELSGLAAKQDDQEDIICFDKLGVDRLFVDEAHNYKNVSIKTNIYGIRRKGATKCDSMMDKVHYVQKTHDGEGVVMATGTPITNSISDIYVFQKYLQDGSLSVLNIQAFDSWAGMYAEQTRSFEVTVAAGYTLKKRFARFHNIPELTSLLSNIADFHSIDSSDGLPRFDGYTNVSIPKSAELKAFLEEISERADRVYKRKVKSDVDNMLKITVDGRKAALDLRLLTQNAGADTLYNQPVGMCKASECAERAAELWHRTKEKRLTQIIFCDISTPKAGFNMYDELKHRLIGLGVDETEIAYIHDGIGEIGQEKLYKDMREGRIRILIGSTSKLGLGVNVQDRLAAVHHLDLPWRPADMVQREGRILRAGNMCDKVDIYRYITEGSFDAYSWQLLETKQRFISDILSGTADGRSGSDIDLTVLDYAEVKALALDNPLIKRRVETENEISRLQILHRKNIESRLRLERRYRKLPDIISAKKLELDACLSDAAFVRMDDGDTHRDPERSEARRRMSELLAEELYNSEMRSEDRTLQEYRGFSIVLPAGMDRNKPYLELVREGRYRVDISDRKAGILIRIDHCLDRLEERADEIRQQKERLEKELRDIETEISTAVDYADLIEKHKVELNQIDEELGVNDLRRRGER